MVSADVDCKKKKFILPTKQVCFLGSGQLETSNFLFMPYLGILYIPVLHGIHDAEHSTVEIRYKGLEGNFLAYAQ